MSQPLRLLKNIAFPLLLLVFSSTYFITAKRLGATIVDGKLSPSFFPSILGTLAIGLSLVLCVRALREHLQCAKQNEEPIIPESAVDRYRILLIIVATAAFILLFQQIGYIFSATAYVFSIILLFSNVSSLPLKLLISLGTAMVVYFLFTEAFSVRLPSLFWS